MRNQKSTPIQSSFDIFLLDCEARRLTDSTIRTYRFRLGAFLSWCESQELQYIQDIEPVHIRSYLVSLNKRELSDYTQRGAGIALKTFFKFCVAERWIDQSPAANVRLQREPKRILPSLHSSDIKKLIEACYTERDKALVMFLLDSGIRGAECIKLKVADVDMKTGIVTIEQGKGRKDRLVRIGARTRKQLLKYLSEVKPKEHLWLSDRGKPLGQFGLIQMLERLSERAGISKVTPHQIRRTFAINCLRNGMDIYILAKLMGHADISVLQRYLDINESDLEIGHKASGPVDNMEL